MPQNKVETTLRPDSYKNGLSDEMYENMPVGVVICDNKGRILRMNRRNCEIFGVTNPELVYGFSVFNDRNILPSHLEQMKVRDDYTYSYELDASNLTDRGEITVKGKRQLLCRFRKVYDDQERHTGYILVNVDLTEVQSELKSEHHHLTRQLEQIQRSSNLMSWRFDVKKGKLFINYSNAPSEYLEPTEVIKECTLTEFVRNIYPDDQHIFLEKFGLFMQNAIEETTIEIRYRFNPSDNEFLWVSMSGVVSEVDEEGNVILVVGSNSIIEGRKRMEEELLAAKEKAEASDRLKSTFIEQTNHEIRTPLNAIVGYADIMASCHQTLDDNSLRELVDGIRQNSEKMLSMVNCILVLSQLNSGTLKYEGKMCSVTDLCSTIVNRYRKYAMEGVNIKFDNQITETPFLLTDSRLISLVLSSLVENAVKFTKEGSIVVTAKCVENGFEFQIADTGPGLPPMEQHIFDLFSKGDRFTPGMGLGLPLSRGLVTFLDGKMNIKTLPGKGTTFTLVIPNKE